MARAIALTGVAQLAIVLSGAVVGMESLAIARGSRGFSSASNSAASAALELAAGWALLLAGVLALRSPGRTGFGAWLCAAGLAWFSTDWNNPEVRSSVLFTGGLVLSTVCPVMVAHTALRNAAPRLHKLESVLLVTAYGSTVLVSGLVPAMLFDPARQGCNACPGNLLALRSDPVALDNVTRAATIAGIGWTCALIIAMTVRLSRSSPSRRGIVVSVSVPAAVYLAAVGLDYGHSIKRGFLGDDAVDHRLKLIESAALIALALGTGWPVLRRRLTRAAVARLVVEAAGTPPVGGLERALGETLGDPSLRILYPLSDGRLADSSGHESTPPAGQSVTRLDRGASTIALLAHRRGLLDADGVAAEITRTAHLALDNERLQAEARSGLVDLCASRARVVETADAERRRLERDLHDGAQQKIVSLALGLRLATLTIDPSDSVALNRLDQAQSEVTAALTELRTLARGLYPRELADEGLAAGLETLAEVSPTPVVLRALPEERYSRAVESAAYFAVAFCAQAANAKQVTVAVSCSDGRLCVDVGTDSPPTDLIRLEDRVGALDGSIMVEPSAADGIRIRVELPCGL